MERGEKKTGTKLASDKEEKTREIIEERVMKTQRCDNYSSGDNRNQIASINCSSGTKRRYTKEIGEGGSGFSQNIN